MQTESLFSSVINYCHEQYISRNCEGCDHQKGCPGNPCGNCKQCLEEVHYPSRHQNGRKDYECDHMMNFYVCDYTAKYASEMLYLMRESAALKKIEDYHVLSIGCGACPDLMALECFCQESSETKTISYIGIDVNQRWKSIHEEISKYKTPIIKKTQFMYFDAVTEDYTISNTNVIVLQYIISHFYNNRQIIQINRFFQKLVEDIIAHKQQELPLVILINDVNSNNRGRDHFIDLIKKLQDSNIHGGAIRYYFDRNIVNQAQRYGRKHVSENVLFDIPGEFESIYQPWHFCSSAQLLIEVQ